MLCYGIGSTAYVDDFVRIAIVDADLIKRKKHRFPNLVCMKLSAFFRKGGHEVSLEVDLGKIHSYDRVYISKVFTDTEIPELQKEFEEFKKSTCREDLKYQFGGTGFYFDKAPDLPYEIEHCSPDYDLYLDWINEGVERERKRCEEQGKTFDEVRFRSQFKEYTDYSIGFLTRGCFRKCPFCVNQKYSRVFRNSPLKEFLRKDKKKICLLDDNFFGFGKDVDDNGVNHSQKGDPPAWKLLLQELKATGLPFKFKQGLDERLLTREICEELFASNYDGDYTFAFDKISDYDVIHQKLEIIRSVPMAKKAAVRFYVLVGFAENEDGSYTVPGVDDIRNAFVRIELLQKYRCLPYIMRFQSKDDKPWRRSAYAKIYTEMARWCNQPSFFKKKSFHEYCWACEEYHRNHGGRADVGSTWRAYQDFARENPEIESKFFHLKFGQVEKLVGEPSFARELREKRERALHVKEAR